MTQQELAEAFCRHDFAAVYPYLADDVCWEQIGEPPLEGKDAVMDWCEQSAAYLKDVTTRFSRFRVIAGPNGVAVDSRAEYVDDAGETTVIASCDLFTFAGETITEITSHTAEITGI